MKCSILKSMIIINLLVITGVSGCSRKSSSKSDGVISSGGGTTSGGTTGGDGGGSTTSAPLVQEISTSLSDGYYGVGDVVPVTVTFSEDITVTGAPKLYVNTSTDAYATYVSYSGNQVQFSYTIQSGDSVTNFNVSDASALVIQDGTILSATTFTQPDLTVPTTPLSTSITIDGVAPTAPGSFVDGTSSGLSQSPELTWSASSDSDSGIDHYEIAIGTTAGGMNVLSWTTIGNVSSYTKTGLSLTDGVTYYASVKAVDLAGNISPVAQGDGWTAVDQPIDCSNSVPQAGSSCTNGLLIGGTMVTGENTYRITVTPKGCNNSATPTCDGTSTDPTMAGGTNSAKYNATMMDNGPKTSAVLASRDSSAAAAKYCENMNYAGFTDWYLPSALEFDAIAINASKIGLSGRYWTSTEDSSGALYIKYCYSVPCDSGYSAGLDSWTNPVRCARRDNISLKASPEALYQLRAILPETNSPWSTVTILNDSAVPVGPLSVSKVGTGVEINASNNNCLNATLLANESCTLQTRITAQSDALVTGSLLVSTPDGATRSVPVNGYVAYDCKNGTPSIGKVCDGGNIFSGSFNYGAGEISNMVPPGGCSNSSNAICPGTTDTLMKVYGTYNFNHNATSTTDGEANTASIVALDSSTDSAARYCDRLNYGGYSDWYLPATDELQEILLGKSSLYGISNYYYRTSSELSTQYATSIYAYDNTTYSSHTKNSMLSPFGPTFRCMRKISTWKLSASSTYVDGLSSILPQQISDSQMVTITNNTGSATGTLSATISTDFEIVSNQCSGNSLPDGGSCEIGVRVNSATAGFKTGVLVVGSGADEASIALSGTVSKNCDDVSITTIGTFCKGGTKLVSSSYLTSYRIMVTPGNCTNSSNPICDGQTDSVKLKYFGNDETRMASARDSADGIVNTNALASQSTALAAKYCQDMVYAGYADWYLPSKDELLLLYNSRSTLGGFAAGKYWSSTGYEPGGINYQAYSHNFSNGTVAAESRMTTNYIRCIRRF